MTAGQQDRRHLATDPMLSGAAAPAGLVQQGERAETLLDIDTSIPLTDSTLHTQGVPELAAAHHTHQRLLQHPRATTAWTTARAITTRWYDHQQHLTHRWHPRLNQLCEANPHLTTTGNASPALLTRDLVIYPETVALARALATLPNRPHHTTDDALSLIAHRLGLTCLTPNANDPLRVFLTHTRP